MKHQTNNDNILDDIITHYRKECADELIRLGTEILFGKCDPDYLTKKASEISSMLQYLAFSVSEVNHVEPIKTNLHIV